MLSLAYILLLLNLLFLPSEASSLIKMELELEPESRIWLEGRSTVGRFTCHGTDAEGQALLEDPRAGEGSSTDAHGQLNVKISVECFECGNERMNRDMFNALRSDQYPFIHFELKHATEVATQDPATNTKRMQVTGLLTVAGNTQQITFTADGSQDDHDRLNASGSFVIRMTDFGVEPPTGLMGVVKAHDELKVNFELIARRM